MTTNDDDVGGWPPPACAAREDGGTMTEMRDVRGSPFRFPEHPCSTALPPLPYAHLLSLFLLAHSCCD